ncbi:flagellin [Methanococcus voltae]|uniref:Putative flagella-related protein G n=3 Tax=Methanococcus voltae TaxID=2188 RepID=FLAG_METVO|nr:flagellar protein G [Methanococcus voltae]O06640.1 RecName: Full=Putative flagella-related protein G [Methanococcus voltae]AAB57831.1 putative flagella-related protein G [Methanococcus voltae PS]MBP2172363.1 flagellar protein FlaG [Methanococcus voltae]MBP2200681.1 flagellar protein FlaG [Methanococcus voltae]MCS3921406.1 flagellar protein FlaG [Methanococcus voltae PS]
MASNVFSEIILFVSVLIITAAVSGILATSTHKISLGLEQRGDALSSQLTKDFEIINDPGYVLKNATDTTMIYLKNTGKSPITFDKEVISVLVDGNPVEISNTYVEGDSSVRVLGSSKVGKLHITYNTSGYHRFKVVTSEGIARTFTGEIV